MRDYYLKFQTEEEFDSIMSSVGLKEVDSYNNIFYGNYSIIVDRIGPIVITPAVNDEDFNEITPPVFDDSYHANVRITDDTEFPTELESYRIQVNSPSREFAGGMFPVQ